tara:strand:+ start:6185 stop:7153 length:969 start_codon:yes stop_codon:yes gene_type:complete
MMILIITEHTGNVVNPVSWEVVAAAQDMPGHESITLGVIGSGLEQVLNEFSQADVSEILCVDDPGLLHYNSDSYVEAWAQIINNEMPDLVLLPHTYRTRDFAPKLASMLGSALITDCIATKERDEGLTFVRPMFQGKFVADVIPEGKAPHFISFQIGSYRADAARKSTEIVSSRLFPVSIDKSAIRQHPEQPFKESQQVVDLSQADRIVAVGRGIKDQEHLPLVQQLAKELGAELAASRPICDAGWLPMDRQVGSSGQTVTPVLYFALGISGAIQHLVGMKGARTIVAINKDADAPIFEIADYGIVGDLFEIVPAIISALEE